MMRRLILLVLIALSLYPVVRAAEVSEATSNRAMVATAHPLATEAGLEMFMRGGNAVDAAVAAAFTLGVVEPYSSGIGGGGFMLVRNGATGEIVVIDYREVAPKTSNRDMYLDAKGEVIPEASDKGYRAAAVPGTVAGLTMAQARFGKLTLGEVMKPAIRCAGGGFAIDEKYVQTMTEERDRLERCPEAGNFLYEPDSEPPALRKAGSRLVQSDLANTLSVIGEEGPHAFYHGKIAKAIVRCMAPNGGLVTLDDLGDYHPRERAPIRGTYRGYEIVTMPPPSSGGVHLIEMLNVLQGYDLKEWGRRDVRTIHVMAETMRRAYADRAEFMGDPAFVTMPLGGLMSKNYAEDLRGAISLDHATSSSVTRAGNPSKFDSPHTTHLCTADSTGWAVALTQTINYSFGSGVVVPDTGILLNNEMDDFSAKAGVPNLYGLVGNDANSIAPGKIPLSSMTPTLVLKDGKLFLVVGSPGGSRIITTVLQVIVNVIDFGMRPGEALGAPRVHHQWLPDELRIEAGAISAETAAKLEALGHKIAQKEPFGNATMIEVDQATGALTGAADPRGVGIAEGISSEEKK